MKKNSGIITDIIFWIAGCSIYSAAVVVLLEPNSISPGGFTGIATLVDYLIGIPSGTVLFLMNIPLIILEYKKFGGSFIIKNVAATVILSITLDIADYLLPEYKVDGILASVFGGIISGLGLSLVLLRGATTGGVDVIAKLVNAKYRHLSVGRVMLASDFLVVTAAAVVYRNIESALYSLIAIYASSKIIDSVLYGSDKGKLIFVITDKADKITDSVLKTLHRGITKLSAVGAYTHSEKTVLMCAVRRHEAAALHKIIKDTDNKAFVLVTDAGEIIGEGFKQ